MLQKLIKTLSQSDLDLATGREIAEVLWLAKKIQGASITDEIGVVTELLEEPKNLLEETKEPTDSGNRLPPLPDTPETEPQAEIVPPPLEQTSALDLPGNYKHIPVRDAPAIAQSLNLARALRPLARQIAIGLPKLLDERATVEQIAETGVWQPVLKSASELWLEVALVFDRSPSMVLWQRLGLDLSRLLSHYGEFRDVRLWWLQPTETGEVNLTRPNGTVCKPRDLLTSDRRRLVVIVSDCVGAAWHNGSMRSVIATWSAKLPTVLFQVFPERLWSRTALARSITVEFQAKQPGLPSDELKPFVRSVWDRERLNTSLHQHQVRLPVVTIEPGSLSSLAAVLVGKRQSHSRVLGIVWDAKPVQLQPVPPIADQPSVALKDRIDSFVLLASPTARQLASLLASAPVITLPIVRLIKQAMLPQASALQIAEVLMSGLLEVSGSQKANFGNAERIAYQLVDEEVRERLRAGTRVVDAQMVLQAVSCYVAENLGKSVDQFWALISSPPPGKASGETAFLSAFATVSAQILRGLGPEFAEIADRLTLLQINPAPDLEPEFAGNLLPKDFDVATIEIREIQTFEFTVATLEGQQSTSKIQPNLVKNCWLFQGSPTFYRMFDAIKDLNEIPWPLNRNKQDISVGDKAIIWISGRQAGIYALGEIIEPVKIFEELSDINYWIDPNMLNNMLNQPGPLIRLTTKLLDHPLLRKDLKQDSILKDLSVIRAPRGSLFKVTPEQWNRVYELINSDQSKQMQWVINRQQRQGEGIIEVIGEGIELELMSIPCGTFWMGSPKTEKDSSDDERPQYQVTVSPFYMGRFPVTQAQWQAVADFPKIDIELDPDPANFKGDNRPVEQINWHEAVEFCQRLSTKTGRDYRLPSEAEWEYACRAGTKTAFHFGETITTDLANYDGNYVYGEGTKGEYRQETTSVDRFKIANNFGLSDLHGNVYEWCADAWHSNYKGAPTDGSVWEEEGDDSMRVIRGGSWYGNPRHCRSAGRLYRTPAYRGRNIGFRVVCAI